MRITRNLIALLLAVAAAAAPASCGTISGTVRSSESGRALSDVAVRAYAEGRSMCVAAASDRDGMFVMDDLKPGRYAVCVGAREDSRPQVASVVVPADGSVEVTFGLSPSSSVDGDSWLQGYPEFYQSFTATGLGVTSLKLKAFGPGRVVTVQMLEGDGPGGRPIGPSRVTPSFGGEGEAAVFWAGGEAPTVPGKRYTFRMSAKPGQVWVPGVAGRGDVYPLGQAYFGKDARPLSDLGFAICEEKDNLSTNYAVAPGRRAILARAVGQSFVARSKNILYAAASLQGAVPKTAFVRFSIHENGPGGKQIGPSKSVGIGDSAVAWLPGEVNVVPGQRYYLHVESFDGTRFYAFEELDPYAKGGAYNDAVLDRGYDLAGWIAGSLSDADQQKLFRHPRAVRSVALVNPSFEQGVKGWTMTKKLGASVGCDGGVLPAWGESMFGWTNKGKGEDSRTIIYQNVRVSKGRHYSFSGSVYTDHRGGRSSDQKVRLVVDPTGRAIFGKEPMESSQWYATEGQWRRGSAEFVAKADTVSVGFELEQRWSLDMCALYADGAQLDEIAEE